MSTRRFGRRPARLAFGLMMVLLAAVACRRSDTPSYQETTSVRETHRISEKEARVISEAAARVLVHLGDARRDIARGQLAAARYELEKADKLLGMITSAMPTIEVRDRIQVAREHLEYESTRNVLPDLVPVYEQLDFLGGYVTTQTARRHLDQARRHLEKGERRLASEELDAAGAAVVYTELDLPLNVTKADVNKALAELVDERAETADRALEDAESRVRVLSVAFQAREGGHEPGQAPKRRDDGSR